ncbi:MAG TPA: HEAT repeat domain-containing protein, partial [Polyangiaceae bacterium]
ARVRVVSLLGRLADARAAEALRAALSDPEPRVQRRAASALGRLPESPETESALLEAFGAAELSERRAIAEALGKVGGERAHALLGGISPADPELARRVKNALLLLERRASRGQECRIVTDRALERRGRLLVRCRAGLAELLAEELQPLGSPRVAGAALVELDFGGPLAELFRARIALEWGFRVDLARNTELAAAVAAALEGSAARGVLSRWTAGRPRFRLEFASGGPARARVFRVAHELSQKLPELVNDPRGASWTFVVVDDVPDPHLVLVPRGFSDPRFAYRRRDVPAASHPTVAAALARAAGPRPGDRVWDPFVGSGLELVERARLGPAAALTGSDIDPEALGAARENLDAAGVRATLVLGDAARHEPGPTSLILTNPPMGRRLVRDRSLGTLLDRFVEHASRVLEPGGRLVWLSPLPRNTRERANSSGLEFQTGQPVDLGGFEVELQIFRRPFPKSRNQSGRS